MSYPAEMLTVPRWCIVSTKDKLIVKIADWHSDGFHKSRHINAEFGTFDHINKMLVPGTNMGFYLGKSDAIDSPPPDVVCIDLDDFLVDGSPAQGGRRNQFFTALAQLTYTEVSNSGKGVHLFFKGTAKEHKHLVAPDKFEIYSESGHLISMGTHDGTSPLTLANYDDANISLLVAGLKDLAGTKSRPQGKYPQREEGYNGLAEKEGRHIALYGIASSLVGQKLPQYEVLARLLSADAKNEPPFGFDYCKRMVDDLLVKEQEKELVNEHLRTSIHHIQSNGSWYDLNNKQVMSTQTLITKYRNKGFTGVKGNQKKGYSGMPVITEWLSAHPDFITVNGVGWLPVPYGTPITEILHDNRKTYSNMWQEYAIEPHQGSIDLWLDLADHLCNHNQAYKDILLDWLAYTVQYPHKKINWHIVISGVQGAGKDSLFKPLGQIYGSNGGAIGLIDGKSLASDFQDAFYAKKFIIVTEISNIRDTTLDYVKRLCATEAIDRITLNPKGLPLIDQINVYSLAFLTNDLAAIRCDVTERRFFMLDCRDKYDNFEAYLDWLDNGGSAAVFDYLLKRDVSKFNASEVIKTEHFYNMFEATRTYEETSLDAMAVSRSGVFAHDFLRVLDVQSALRLQHQEVSHAQVLLSLHNAGYEKVRNDVKDQTTGRARRAVKKIDGKMATSSDAWYGIADNEHMVSRSGAKLYEAIKEAEQAIEKEQINRKF